MGADKLVCHATCRLTVTKYTQCALRQVVLYKEQGVQLEEHNRSQHMQLDERCQNTRSVHAGVGRVVYEYA